MGGEGDYFLVLIMILILILIMNNTIGIRFLIRNL